MARCPFAQWQPISGSSGLHLGGPFKIVHHTTEGSTAEGAMSAFAANRSDPHFTVDDATIWQHVDTAEGARALRNMSGGVQTNRDSAIQIELVGFAGRAKSRRALTNVARLCRWIEATHAVPAVWPSGFPLPAKNGKDPGGHNRSAQTWDNEGGHYGHSQVPENTHWDPAYTQEEAQFILDATFDAAGNLTSAAPPAPPPAAMPMQPAKRPGAKVAVADTAMHDHHETPTGFDRYLEELRLASAKPFDPASLSKRLRPARAGRQAARATPTAASGQPQVDAGSLLCFVDGLTAQEQEDVLYSVQLAQRAASAAADRFTQTRAWYEKYVEVLENLGWSTEQFSFSRYDQAEGEFRMDKAALAIITAIATQNQLAVLQEAVNVMGQLADDDGAITLFDFHASLQASGNFQLGSVQRTPGGALSMALGAFYFRAADDRKRFLFFKWGAQQVHFWTAAQRMTLNTAFYAQRRERVKERLAEDADDYLAAIPLGPRRSPPSRKPQRRQPGGKRA